ncbi:hypothetical protein ACOMHN_010984 [Nucella lapillus]
MCQWPRLKPHTSASVSNTAVCVVCPLGGGDTGREQKRSDPVSTSPAVQAVTGRGASEGTVGGGGGGGSLCQEAVSGAAQAVTGRGASEGTVGGGVPVSGGRQWPSHAAQAVTGRGASEGTVGGVGGGPCVMSVKALPCSAGCDRSGSQGRNSRGGGGGPCVRRPSVAVVVEPPQQSVTQHRESCPPGFWAERIGGDCGGGTVAV